ncbi:MAG: hypothetical protein NZL89_00045 [Leptospiraceae bacterium]|nr:hypothetical protein [Leptospiraceae bacterium]
MKNAWSSALRWRDGWGWLLLSSAFAMTMAAPDPKPPPTRCIAEWNLERQSDPWRSQAQFGQDGLMVVRTVKAKPRGENTLPQPPELTAEDFLFFRNQDGEVVANARYFHKLRRADLHRIQPGHQIEIAQTGQETRRLWPHTRLLDILFNYHILVVYVHTQAKVCLTKFEENQGFQAEFWSEYSYYTAKRYRGEGRFAVTLDDKTGSIFLRID